MAIVLDLARRPITLVGGFVLCALALVLVARGSTGHARTATSPAPATSLQAESVQAIIERGSRALELGRYDEAIAAYRLALQLQPDSAVAYNLLGMAYHHRFTVLRVRTDRDQEIESFRAAVRIDPGYVPALVNLGRALYLDDRPAEAAPLLQRALALDPQHPDRDQIVRMLSLTPAAGAQVSDPGATAAPADPPPPPAAAPAEPSPAETPAAPPPEPAPDEDQATPPSE